ncbi:MAG: VOC family protein [Actinobacteria bacterium]|nr:MAG: VOC family protein [Actinomycetota bacterium]
MEDLHDVIERLDHVSIAVWDIAAAAHLPDLLGGRFRDGGLSHRRDFRWAQWDLPFGKLEMIAPIDPGGDNFLTRFLREHGEGPHHLTFKVGDIEHAVARAEELGFEVVGRNTEHDGWKEAFIHPRSSHGVLIQLAEFDDRWRTTGRTLDDALSEAP